MDRDDIDQIKRAIDLVQIINSRVQLKRSGTNRWVGLCPFHTERTPSFSVNAEAGFWYCFGCGEHGDVITFLQKIYGMSFQEAIQQLAEQAGIVLQPQTIEDVQADQIKKAEIAAAKKLLATLVDESARCLQQTPQAQEAREWLKNRHCSKAQALEWNLGFGDSQILATAKMQDNKLAYDLGLTAAHWKDRILFPLYDQTGTVIALSGRKLRDEGPGGKYINSPANLLYDKSKILYGMHHAAKHARQMGYIVLVEGQMDCLAMHAMGYANTVATCGTAMSINHLRWISKLVPKLILAFDADEAGIKGIDRVLVTARGMPMTIQWALLPRGKDPSDLLMSNRKDIIDKAITRARTPIQVHLSRLSAELEKTNNVQERSRLINEGMAHIEKIYDPIERHSYYERWADKFSVPIPLTKQDHRRNQLGMSELDMRALYLLFNMPAIRDQLKIWMLQPSAQDIATLYLQGKTVMDLLSDTSSLDEMQKQALAHVLQSEDQEDDPDMIVKMLVLRSANQIIAETEDLLQVGVLARMVALAKNGNADAVDGLVQALEMEQWKSRPAL